MFGITLSEEQELFIDKALEGNNILVDACIGSGKTTSIQQLCLRYPVTTHILYLTYNRLLKLDAKEKIKQNNVMVTNYHGFASLYLNKVRSSVGMADLIQEFIKIKPPFPIYDVLVIDEYQDIDHELSEMLEIIKATNPAMQIIAVGDMEQKIYNKTVLDVREFIDRLLGEHLTMTFTQCFRLNKEHAAMLGRVWGKTIIGTNEKCEILNMPSHKVADFLSNYEPGDILCLGSRTGAMTSVLNELERKRRDKFNKNTVFASIADYDSVGSKVHPKYNDAIFTTFDSSKGLERKICVVFDFEDGYWYYRARKPLQSYEILRNIFCVAASRGKEKIVFVNDRGLLSAYTLSTPTKEQNIQEVSISELFQFKYVESVEECYSLIQKTKIPVEDNSVIDIMSRDGLIDLSPCIGIYQEASYFEGYNIDKAVQFYKEIHKDDDNKYEEAFTWSTEKKILFLTSKETKQNRYLEQVSIPYVSGKKKEQIHQRLSTVFNRSETVQKNCYLSLKYNNNKSLMAQGIADVVKDGIVYELKFVSDLTHEHFLQCACYIIALDLKEGILWNIKNNERYKITVPDKEMFLKAVALTAVKDKDWLQHEKYGYVDRQTDMCANGEKPNSADINKKTREKSSKKERKAKEPYAENYRFDDLYHTTDKLDDNIAVIDVETTLYDHIISIGIVIAGKDDLQPKSKNYYIIKEFENEPCYYYGNLYNECACEPIRCSYTDAVSSIKSILGAHGVKSLFAYNAAFDRNHLPQLDYTWIDIMKIAAYKQYNSKLPNDAEYYTTGRLKNNYSAESILQLLTNDNEITETHNAICDAVDELRIMRLLGVSLETYYLHARISDQKNTNHSNNKKTHNSSLLNVPNENREVRYEIIPDSIRDTAENYSLEQYYTIMCDEWDREKEKKQGRDKKETAAEHDERKANANSEGNTSENATNENRISIKENPGVATRHGKDLEGGTNDTDCGDNLESDYITSSQAAQILRISRSSVYNLIKRGKIKAIKKRGTYQISRESVETYSIYRARAFIIGFFISIVSFALIYLLIMLAYKR